MEKKEEYEEDGCEGWGEDFKPYKLKYRIITEGEEIVCMDKDGSTLDYLMESLEMKAWNLGDFTVSVLGKERVEHIDG